MSLPFDSSEWFSFDKPADVACRHLRPNQRCAIHEQLPERGHAGCAHYDCYGAGQRITQELFPGRSWRSDPAQAPRLFEAFRRLKRLHELWLLLCEAQALALPPEHAEQLARLSAQLEPTPQLDAEALAKLDLAALEHDVHAFLRSLGGYVTPRRRLPLLPSS